MNDLEISLFQMTGVRKWSCSPGPIVPSWVHSQKKQGGKKGRTEVWPHPACTSQHPQARDSTDVTSCLCHRADCFVVSDGLRRSPPCALPSLVVLLSFCCVFRNNKETPERRLETSFLSLAVDKDSSPSYALATHIGPLAAPIALH